MGYELIEKVEVGSGGASSIEFTSIPQNGTDLLLLTSLRDTGGSTRYKVAINGDESGFDYANTVLRINGDVVDATGNTDDGFGWLFTNSSSTESNTFSNGSVYIANYASTGDKLASIDAVAPDYGSQVNMGISASIYTGGTSGVSSIKIYQSNNLEQYSTASLYKITTA